MRLVFFIVFFFLYRIEREDRDILADNQNRINTFRWTDVDQQSQLRPKRLGLSSRTLGISVSNAWDSRPIRLGFLSQTLGIPVSYAWESLQRSLHASCLRYAMPPSSEGSEGSEGEFSNFFRKYQNLNSPIHIFRILEKVLKNACLSFGTFGNPIHSAF